MTIRRWSALLCGVVFVLATQTAFAVDDKKKSGAEPGNATFVTASANNIKTSAACTKAKGAWDKAAKSCKFDK